MITKTEAVVLRSIDYQESSKIVTLFTRRHGKIVVIAKGARKPKSKFSAFLVPGQLLEVVYYLKNSRSVQTLSEVSYLAKLHNLRTDLSKMALSVTTLELAAQTLHENEVNEEMFSFLCNLLEWIDSQESVSKIIFPYIQVRITQILGVGLQFEDFSGTPGDSGYINIRTGSLSDIPEGDEAIRLSEPQFAFLRKSLHSMNSEIFNIELTKNELNKLIEHLDQYIRYHIEGVRPRKSDAIFEQLL